MLSCYCYAIKTKSTTIRYQVSQPASADKGANMSELRTCPKRFGGLAITTLPRSHNQEERTPLKFFTPPGKCVRHSLKNLGPSRKPLRPTWCSTLVTRLLCPDGPRVHLSSPAYMPSCIRPEIRFPLDQHVLCSDCCKKSKLLRLAQVVFSYFVLHSSKILYLWCLPPKLHICAACCSDSQMELIV